MKKFAVKFIGAAGTNLKVYPAVNKKEALLKALEDGAISISEIEEGVSK